MLNKLINNAVEKAGSQQKLADKLGLKYQNRFGDYKAGRRVPDDELIGQLAEYAMQTRNCRQRKSHALESMA